MKNTAKLLAVLILVLVSMSSLFAGCVKGPMIQPTMPAVSISSMDPYGDGLHAIINNLYRVKLNTPFPAQIAAKSANNANSIPLYVTINGILFLTSGNANIGPNDMGNIRKGLAAGNSVQVMIEFCEVGSSVGINITSVVQF